MSPGRSLGVSDACRGDTRRVENGSGMSGRRGCAWLQARSLPLTLAWVLRRQVSVCRGAKAQRTRDFKYGTYGADERGPTLSTHIDQKGVEVLLRHREVIAEVSGRYLAHRFDILGSGWVRVYRGMRCAGFEGYRFAPAKCVAADRQGVWLEEMVNASNVAKSQRIWRLIFDTGDDIGAPSSYTPIDWQLDFRSGYRWSERTWYLDIKYGDVSGADVKVPWELGRMQHLLFLAWAFALAKGGCQGVRPPSVYANEFRNQILDFLATNPPRFGVQWVSSMDVAIRVVNWLVAYDVMRAHGAEFDDGFERVFTRSIRSHGRHLVQNLDWSPRLRHNHYLADIVGLLFVAAYLPPDRETDCWLRFARQELLAETKEQFNQDRSNFEGSTCYHRLSSEMVAFATALLLGLQEGRSPKNNYQPLTVLREMGVDCFLISLYRWASKDKAQIQGVADALVPGFLLQRLAGMAEFTSRITKPDGHVPQIGDNDSGRFLKAMPAFQKMRPTEAKVRFANLSQWEPENLDEWYWFEDTLDHGHLVDSISALLGRNDVLPSPRVNSVDAWLVCALAGETARAPGEGWRAYRQGWVATIGADQDFDRLQQELNRLGDYQRRTTVFDLRDEGKGLAPLTHGLQTFGFPDFGLYVFKSSRLYLAIRCGAVGRRGCGGHNHNDQLSLELMVDGRTWVADPGTYVYTSLPEVRNRYRSVYAHFAPQAAGREPAPLDSGLFSLPDRTRSEVLYFGHRGFVGMHRGFGRATYRRVNLKELRVTVVDLVPHQGENDEGDTYRLVRRPLEGPLPFSPGYGVIASTGAIR